MSGYVEIHLDHTFDAGHRIVGHKGKCSRLHGHTYRIEVIARGPTVDPGFVVDFGDIKDMIDKWDHRFLLWDKDPILVARKVPLTGFQEDEGRTRVAVAKDSESGIVRLPFNPTVENMVEHLAIEMFSTYQLAAIDCQLWETPKSSARYSV